MASFNFDSTTVAPDTKAEPIPAGSYIAQVTDSDLIAAKSGSGNNLRLVFEVLDGQFKGRKVFENLCVQHTNAETQRIAQSKLSALCHATGVIRISDSSELHGYPVKINVAIQQPQNGYDAKNVIKGFESSNAAAGGFNAPKPAAPASSAPVWANKKAA